MKRTHVAVVAACLFTASCGALPLSLNLSAPPPLTVQLTPNPKPRETDPISVTRPTGPGRNIVIGYIPNPPVSADIVVRDDPGLWIANAMVAGLEQAGYEVRRIDNMSDATTATVITFELSQIAADLPISGMDMNARLIIVSAGFLGFIS